MSIILYSTISQEAISPGNADSVFSKDINPTQGGSPREITTAPRGEKKTGFYFGNI